MKRLLIMTLLLGATGAVANGEEYRGFRTYNLSCDSEQSNLKYCRLRTDTVGVIKQKTTSGSKCNFGETWGYSSRYIWVNDGCAADFIVFEDMEGDDYKHIMCQSINYQVGTCPTREFVDPSSLRLVIQTSSSTCRLYESWGFDYDQWIDGDYLWTTDGCSGLFTYKAREVEPGIDPEPRPIEPSPPSPGIGPSPEPTPPSNGDFPPVEDGPIIVNPGPPVLMNP